MASPSVLGRRELFKHTFVVHSRPTYRKAQTMASAAVNAAVPKEYESLCEKLKEISTLSGVSGLLSWDEMVMMPSGAANIRAAQKSAMTGVVYDKSTSADLGELIKAVGARKNELDDHQAAVVREADWDFKKATSVPKDIEKRRSELESEGYQAWITARSANNFSKFTPVLEEWIELTKKRSKCIDPSLPAYDVALQDYEKGMSSARLDQIFSQLKEGLLPFIKELREKGKAPDASVLAGTFDSAAQSKLCNRIATDLGFNLDNGRLDVSVHPFTGGSHPTDVRMTTRFKPDDLTEGLTGAIHETGHALYEQNRNLKYDGLPVNQALSLGIHESQSLLWERMVALSQPFAEYLTPLLKQSFSQLPGDLSSEQVYGALNAMKIPSFIRVESDEVQYALHILLRYELERALLDGKMEVSDLPRVWNEKMQEYLGFTPETDAKGCLQDVHWAAGLLGYFPTYSLGAMYACQLFQAAKKDLPQLDDDIAAGKFEPLRSWLKKKVHSRGSYHTSGDELMTEATGGPLDPSVFLAYLKDKYSKLYQL